MCFDEVWVVILTSILQFRAVKCIFVEYINMTVNCWVYLCKVSLLLIVSLQSIMAVVSLQSIMRLINEVTKAHINMLSHSAQLNIDNLSGEVSFMLQKTSIPRPPELGEFARSSREAPTTNYTSHSHPWIFSIFPTSNFIDCFIYQQSPVTRINADNNMIH